MSQCPICESEPWSPCNCRPVYVPKYTETRFLHAGGEFRLIIDQSESFIVVAASPQEDMALSLTVCKGEVEGETLHVTRFGAPWRRMDTAEFGVALERAYMGRLATEAGGET
jgi:imidazoleglycerol phosphate dehydratase HisB